MRERIDETDVNIAGSLPSFGYRVETVRAGELIMAGIYPVDRKGREIPRTPKALTSEAQRKANARRAEQRAISLINANFGEGDIFVTLTQSGKLPTDEEARRYVRNYIARVRYHYRQAGVPEQDIRYFYVCESVPDTEETRGRPKVRLHHHLFITALRRQLSAKWQKKGIYTDRQLLEHLWQHGDANTRVLKPGVYGPGLKNISSYIAKDPHGAKRWGASKNLKEPRITYSDSRCTHRKAYRMATDRVYYVRTLEKWYPGYTVREASDPAWNEINGCAYLYALLERDRLDDQKESKKAKEGDIHGQRNKRGAVRQRC